MSTDENPSKKQTQNVEEGNVGNAIVAKLKKANEDLSTFANEIQISINKLIEKVNVSKQLGNDQQTELKKMLEEKSKEVEEAIAKVGESDNRETLLKQQLQRISAEVKVLEDNIEKLKNDNLDQTNKINNLDKMDNRDNMFGGYQYKNPRSKRKLNKNNRFGVLKTKSKSKSKKGKKKRKLGKGKKSMRGGMKKRTKSKRKSKNSKKTRKRRKKNKRK